MSLRTQSNRIVETRKNAEAILATFRIYEPPVPESLVNKIFGNAHILYLQLDESIYGFSYRDKTTDRWYILINNIFSQEIQRFTLFHELYHILNGKPGYSKGTILGNIEEFYADLFSANLLMPYNWFIREWEKTHDIKKMAEIFRVSERAVEIRLKNKMDYANV